jgi:hypothetical protein
MKDLAEGSEKTGRGDEEQVLVAIKTTGRHECPHLIIRFVR